MADEKTEDKPEESKPAAGQDGQFEICVSPDKLVADLKVIPPKDGGAGVTADSILKKAGDLGLKKVRSDAVAPYLTDGNFVQPLKIAEGIAPVDGKDGSVVFLYLEKGGPREDKHGAVDHRNVSTFKLAAKDEQILKCHPPVDGTDGKSVYGDAIAFTPGKNPAPSAGKNVRVSPDGADYFAADAGLVMMAGNEISVDKVLKTEGDLDFHVGNIDFDGTVIITGAILEGFKVKATGDVMAQLISQATVDAGGNVVVEKGIIGAKGLLVKAKGDVTAKFIENAHVEAGGNVTVTESILHSDVSAGKHVIVRGGKHCNITGGTVHVGGSVEARVIGAEASTKTVIEVGFDPVARARLQHLEAELTHQAENREKVKQAVATLTKLKAQAGSLPADKEQLLKKLIETESTLDRELQDFKKEHADLQESLKRARPGTVSARDSIQPGTTVTILSETTKINKKYTATTVYLDREHKTISFTSFKEIEI